MKTRRVGATDLIVSQIGFGCGGNAGLMVRGTAAEQERVIGRALNLGITYFDNAPDYGDGLSEENLGRALQALKARPVINTKVEIRAGHLGDMAGHVVRSVEGSLRRLRIDAADIVQIHNGPVAVRPNLRGRDYKTLWIEDYLRPGGAIDGDICGYSDMAPHNATVSAFGLDAFKVTVGRFRKFVDQYTGTPPAVGDGANPSIAGSGWGGTGWTTNAGFPPTSQAEINRWYCRLDPTRAGRT